VEDDELVRNFALETLQEKGYNLFSVSTPQEALQLAGRRPFDLLITDVILPTMNGRDLHEEIQKAIPQIKTLYISGYTDNIIIHQGILDSSVHFLQKPFNGEDLLTQVKNVLHQKS